MTGLEAPGDEREALAKALFDARDGEFDLDEWEDLAHVDRERWYCYADAALKVLRKHPEPEMEYEVTYASNSSTTVDGYPIRRTSGVMSDLAKAREFAAIARNPLLRERTKAVPAGPWVPVGEGEQ